MECFLLLCHEWFLGSSAPLKYHLRLITNFLKISFHELIFFFATTRKKSYLNLFFSYSFFSTERSSSSLRKSLETESSVRGSGNIKIPIIPSSFYFFKKFFSFLSFSFVRKQVLIMNIWLTTDDDEVNYI